MNVVMTDKEDAFLLRLLRSPPAPCKTLGFPTSNVLALLGRTWLYANACGTSTYRLSSVFHLPSYQYSPLSLFTSPSLPSWSSGLTLVTRRLDLIELLLWCLRSP